MQDTGKTCAVIEADVSSHVSSSQAAWQELFSAQETDLRKHSDHLNGVVLNHAHWTTESLQSLHAAAQTQEALLEEQRSDMVTLVRERQDDLEAHTTSLSDWALLLGTEMKQRNEDVVKFLVEDLRQDGECVSFVFRSFTNPLLCCVVRQFYFRNSRTALVPAPSTGSRASARRALPSR